MKLNKVFEHDNIAIYAKNNCTKCYGRGWVGTYTNVGEFFGQKIPCKCLHSIKLEKPVDEFKPFAPLTAKVGEEIK